MKQNIYKHRELVKTQANRESHQVLQTFLGISRLGPLLRNSPSSAPALDVMRRRSAGGAPYMLELNLNSGCFLHCLCDHGEQFLLSEPRVFKCITFKTDNSYQLHGVVVRIQCGNLYKRY